MTTPEPRTSSLLDGALIRRRRLSLGITERELASELGVSGVVIYGIERGRNHDDLAVGMLVALAAALALDIEALFCPAAPKACADAHDSPPQPHTGMSPDAHGDTAILGALLLAAGATVPLSVLAEANGWTLERVALALDALEDALTGVGLRLQRFRQGHVRLVGAAPATDTIRALLRASMARTGMNLRQANMLYRVWSGTVTGAEQSNSDRVALGELINAGLVTYDASIRGTRPQLSADVAHSLQATAGAQSPAGAGVTGQRPGL